MKLLETYLSESLYNHLSIDYELYEAAGLYDGIEDLCKFLTNKIKSHQEKEFTITYNSDDRELHNIKNVFFDNITLKCIKILISFLSHNTKLYNYKIIYFM